MKPKNDNTIYTEFKMLGDQIGYYPYDSNEKLSRLNTIHNNIRQRLEFS